MDLTPSDEQRLLRESVDRFIASTYTAEARRRSAAEPLGFSAEVWKQFSDLGWLALPVSEEHGGLGGGPVEVGILMEAFGRGLVSEPYLATVVLGAALIEACGTDVQKQELLPQVAEGSLHLAFAHSERAARFDLAHVDAKAHPFAGGWRLEGEKIAVLDARAAESLIVSARIPDGPLALFLMSPNNEGVTLQDYPRLGGGQGANLLLRSVQVESAARLGNEDAQPAIASVVDRALTALCAEAVGIMQVLLDTTLEYTKARKQFGRPLVANQVVRHRLTDMSVACDEARSMALRAALMAGSNPVQRGRAASGAKAKVGKAARYVAEQAVQLHGAMGVTDELDVGAYFKRLLAFETLFGGSNLHFRRHAALGGSRSTGEA